jgi:maleylpyruvate isomerase
MSANPQLTLFGYFRSSAAYRVRIALAVKGLKWSAVVVNLAKGEQRQADFLKRNPQGLVPALQIDDAVITQSLAIIEYLDECYPQPALLAGDAVGRAIIRSMAQQIAMEIHPLNNLRVLNYLTGPLAQDEEAKLHWYRHWIDQGFTALECSLKEHSGGNYCYGDSVTMADVCLIPQVYNARRFDCNLDPFPLIRAIDAHCNTRAAFLSSAPEKQVDFPK